LGKISRLSWQKIPLFLEFMQLLVLSNGHGEDLIAVRILEQLQQLSPPPKLSVLPLVGKGHAYTQLGIPIIGPVQQMPSGGFIYMDGQQLWRDVRGGLIQLTLAQYQVVRKWGKTGGMILAVGDIVPLLFAWLSGANYAFVGTAKSEYYLRDEAGWLPQTSRLERWLGSVYLPWERWLLSRHRCKAVFPRDKLTTDILRQWAIPAFDLGNPMMDGIVPTYSTPSHLTVDALEKEKDRSPMALLLPGSRSPEAERNWQILITAIETIIARFSTGHFSLGFKQTRGYWRIHDDRSLVFLGAIAPVLALEPFEECLFKQGWMSQPRESVDISITDPKALAFTKHKATLLLTQYAYQDCLLMADLAIAMAGTATEQFVGLGKPVITVSGEGPQFTYAFAEAQTRLLGPSVMLVKQPGQVAEALQSLWDDPDRWQLIADNGQRRMGSTGAAYRIARCLMEKFSHQ
jgi:uncharacterized protein (TIGR03492 family)